MTFKSEPNMFIRIVNKNVQRATGKKGLYFDGNGHYETDNEVLCKVLGQNFEVIPESLDEIIPEVIEETEVIEEVIEEIIEEVKPTPKKRGK